MGCPFPGECQPFFVNIFPHLIIPHPLHRLYARYFLGDLSLTSMDGYGTDAVISLKVGKGKCHQPMIPTFLQAIPSEASELLPVFGASSRRLITMSSQAP